MADALDDPAPDGLFGQGLATPLADGDAVQDRRLTGQLDDPRDLLGREGRCRARPGRIVEQRHQPIREVLIVDGIQLRELLFPAKPPVARCVRADPAASCDFGVAADFSETEDDAGTLSEELRRRAPTHERLERGPITDSQWKVNRSHKLAWLLEEGAHLSVPPPSDFCVMLH